VAVLEELLVLLMVVLDLPEPLIQVVAVVVLAICQGIRAVLAVQVLLLFPAQPRLLFLSLD
jgi:hypothetical protein